MWNKVKGIGILAILLFFVISNPRGAAAAANMLGHALSATATGVGAFFTALNGGGH